jgi:hypothetical protein
VAPFPKVLQLSAVVVLSVATPIVGYGQAEALTGLLGNATDFNFSWIFIAPSHRDLKPDRSKGTQGFGFELSFDLPGAGITKHRRARTAEQRTEEGKASTCLGKFNRALLGQDSACADTTFKLIEKRADGPVLTPEITEFDWHPTVFSFEAAVGFSQSGAYEAADGSNTMRASIREAPSVSLYLNLEDSIKGLPGKYGAYAGARSGLVSLVGGKAFIADTVRDFGGTTFQLGPVLGAVGDYGGLNLFAESAYMWREIKSIEWQKDITTGDLPKRARLSGWAFAVGVQFHFKDASKK